MKAAVLGAGIAGLTTALVFQRAGYSVSLISASSSIEETCTFHSGAWWIDSFENEANFKRRASATFEMLADEARQGQTQAIFFRKGRVYYPTVKTTKPWFAELLPSFRFLEESELPSELGARSGIEIETLFIHPERWAACLRLTLQEHGASFSVRHVVHIDELLAEYDLVINCSGLGARSLGGVEDRAVFPVRGQTMLVQLPNASSAQEFASVRESGHPWSILPRGDGLYLLNGTYDSGNYSKQPSESVAREIWAKCVLLMPTWFQAATFVSHQVGLRPARTGGVRLELEQPRPGKLLLHNYGHGGDGVVLSYGCAVEALQLLSRAKL